MKIIGLTGSIGMGKSETARMFRARGVPVFDADAAVHALQVRDGPAIAPIAAEFPGVVNDGVLDRQALGALVFADPQAKKRLEAIMHPMVAEGRVAFFKAAEAAKAPFVVLDIPLLFETGADKACHKIVVVSALADVQRARVLARPGMTEAKFEDILKRQVPDADKRARADYIIDTGHGLARAQADVDRIIRDLSEK